MFDRINDILHGMMLTTFFVMSFMAFLNTQKEHKPVRLNIALGLLTGMMGMQSLEYLIFSLMCSDRDIVHDPGLSLIINLLIVPLCNLLVMELMRYKRITVRMMQWQMGVPLTLVAAYYVQLLYDSHYRHLTLTVYVVWMSVFSSYYIYHIVRVARVYEKLVENVYADTEGRKINWMKRVLLLLFVVTVLFMLLKVFIGNEVSRIAYIPLCLVFWIFLCWHILQMRCVDSIEITDQNIEAVNDNATSGDYTEFLASLRNTLLDDRLYAHEDLTREIVAKLMGTNYKYLTQQLKEATGMTFSAYVNNIRLEQSIHMLRDTDMTVEEIFFACGYQTKSTYYRAFSKKYGCTPLEYRRKKSNCSIEVCK